jgi:hypothetical protein
MNKKRRVRLSNVVNGLNVARINLEDIYAEECQAMESIPENLQETERYSNTSDNVDDMDDAMSDLDSAIESLNNVIER